MSESTLTLSEIYLNDSTENTGETNTKGNSETDFNDLMKNTINKYFQPFASIAIAFKTEKDLLEHFFYNEEQCLKYIKSKTNYNKTQRHIFKTIVLDSIKGIFKTEEPINKTALSILSKVRTIRSDVFKNNSTITFHNYTSTFHSYFNTKNIPKFLWSDIKKYLKHKLYISSITRSENNSCFTNWGIWNMINDKVNTYLIGTENAFNCLPDKHKLWLEIFILSNVKLFKPYSMCANWLNDDNFRVWTKSFALAQSNETWLKWIKSKVELDSIDIATVLKQYFTVLNISENMEWYVAFFASFHYFIFNVLTESSLPNKDKINFDVWFDNVIRACLNNSPETKLNKKSLLSEWNIFRYKYHRKNEGDINMNLDYSIFEPMIKRDTKLYDRYIITKDNFTSFRMESKTNIVQHLAQYAFRTIPLLKYFQDDGMDYLKRIRWEPIIAEKYTNTITILVSGFLSEDAYFDSDWKHVINDYLQDTMFYYYKWPSFSIMNWINSWMKLNLKWCPDFWWDSFKTARNSSKQSGKLLGILLSSRIFDCKINLIGFSLGCNVIKQCLSEMMKHNKGSRNNSNIISNVVLIAGAANIKDNSKWENIFNTLVSGRVINCFSRKDLIWKHLYQIAQWNEPIGYSGMNMQKKGDKDNFIENYDFTENNLGHLTYRERFNEVIMTINLL